MRNKTRFVLGVLFVAVLVSAWCVRFGFAAAGWSQTYGGSGDDEAYSVIQTSDGGYALAGFTNSSGAGSYDFWLVKTNSSGGMMWNQTYGGAGDDEASNVIQTSDGGYALAGYTASLGAGIDDFWLVKTDSSGNMLWNRTYGGSGDDEASCVIQTSDGGYALAGATNSSGTGGYDFWLVKTDSSGQSQWNQTYGGTYDEAANSLVQTSDGGYALAGWTGSYGAGDVDYWLVKTDSSGSTQWSQTYGGAGDDESFSLVQTSDVGYALVGFTSSYGAGDYDAFLVKTDSSGNSVMPQSSPFSAYFSLIVFVLIIVVMIVLVVVVVRIRRRRSGTTTGQQFPPASPTKSS